MIEQMETSTDAGQVSTIESPHQAMTDLDLQQAFECLSCEIETQKREERPQDEMERLEWEATLLRRMYQRESIQYEQISRSIAHLERCWTAARVRQATPLLEGVYV